MASRGQYFSLVPR
ncbi:hypothetical protein LINPERPRIM_LOCUS1962 [Linum perenne]